ncbi:MAG: tetratricopeptide repeat protein [Pyrinomonadaceae bacterium]
MIKDRLIFGIGGIILGAVLGFTFANSINRAPAEGVSTAGSNAAPAGVNPNLPPDHPPFVPMGDQPQNAPLPQVTEAIEKARQNPNDFEAQMTAGDLYYQIQRFDDAVGFYTAANKLKPSDAESVLKLGNALFDAEKYVEAEKWYIQALETNPNDVNVRADLGLTYFLRIPRDIDRAVREFEFALKLEPENEILLQNLVIAYREKNDTAKAEAAEEKLRSVNPKNPALVKQAPDAVP